MIQYTIIKYRILWLFFSATYLKNNKEKYMNKILKLVKTLSS